jgi:hypothetical protein
MRKEEGKIQTSNRRFMRSGPQRIDLSFKTSNLIVDLKEMSKLTLKL